MKKKKLFVHEKQERDWRVWEMNIQMHSQKVLGNAKGAVRAHHHHRIKGSAEMKINTKKAALLGVIIAVSLMDVKRGLVPARGNIFHSGMGRSAMFTR